MVTNTLEAPVLDRTNNIPQTPRGRAMKMTDWFLNGKPLQSHYDNPRMSVRSLVVPR